MLVCFVIVWQKRILVGQVKSSTQLNDTHVRTHMFDSLNFLDLLYEHVYKIFFIHCFIVFHFFFSFFLKIFYSKCHQLEILKFIINQSNQSVFFLKTWYQCQNSYKYFFVQFINFTVQLNWSFCIILPSRGLKNKLREWTLYKHTHGHVYVTIE